MGVAARLRKAVALRLESAAELSGRLVIRQIAKPSPVSDSEGQDGA